MVIAVREASCQRPFAPSTELGTGLNLAKGIADLDCSSVIREPDRRVIEAGGVVRGSTGSPCAHHEPSPLS